MATTVKSLDRVTSYLSRLPGIGEKTALRLALHLLRSSGTLAEELARSLLDLKEHVRMCPTCCALTESTSCDYCASPRRTSDTICVVEDVADLLAVERTHPQKWHFHVLHGVLSPLDGISPNDLRIKELLERLRSDTVKEVILATNASVEGEATAVYLTKILAPLGVRISRIAQGIPMGSDLEYLDQATLTRALDLRKDITPHVSHQQI